MRRVEDITGHAGEPEHGVQPQQEDLRQNRGFLTMNALPSLLQMLAMCLLEHNYRKPS